MLGVRAFGSCLRPPGFPRFEVHFVIWAGLDCSRFRLDSELLVPVCSFRVRTTWFQEALTNHSSSCHGEGNRTGLLTDRQDHRQAKNLGETNLHERSVWLGWGNSHSSLSSIRAWKPLCANSGGSGLFFWPDLPTRWVFWPTSGQMQKFEFGLETGLETGLGNWPRNWPLIWPGPLQTPIFVVFWRIEKAKSKAKSNIFRNAKKLFWTA